MMNGHILLLLPIRRSQNYALPTCIVGQAMYGTQLKVIVTAERVLSTFVVLHLVISDGCYSDAGCFFINFLFVLFVFYYGADGG